MNRPASRFRRRPVASKGRDPRRRSPMSSCERVPKKLRDFFDQCVLQLFDFELRLIDQMMLSDRDAH